MSKKPETDPAGRNPKEKGAKLDHGKMPIERGLLAYFPRAAEAVAEVSAFGAQKYAWNGWETVPMGIARYGDAMLRHVTGAAKDEGFENRSFARDHESQLLHAAHAAWCAMARLELILREMESTDVADV